MLDLQAIAPGEPLLRRDRARAREAYAAVRLEVHPLAALYRDASNRARSCDLYTVIGAVEQWGERWVLGTKPLWLRHRDCGGEIGMYIFCEVCGESLGVRQARFTAVYREGCREAHDDPGESSYPVSSAGP